MVASDRSITTSLGTYFRSYLFPVPHTHHPAHSLNPYSLEAHDERVLWPGRLGPMPEVAVLRKAAVRRVDIPEDAIFPATNHVAMASASAETTRMAMAPRVVLTVKAQLPPWSLRVRTCARSC